MIEKLQASAKFPVSTSFLTNLRHFSLLRISLLLFNLKEERTPVVNARVRVTKKSRYIPKRLVPKVERMNNEKAPVEKILKVLQNRVKSQTR